ncbi:hypothetical protein LCGC14_2842420, partial [marine sediment metagenome]
SLAFLVNGENFTWNSSGYPESESKISDLIIDHLTLARSRSVFNGPIESITFDPDLSSYGYPAEPDYGKSTVKIFGEWERLPMGGVYLAPGNYTCQIILTEESFHGSGGNLRGQWAAVMGGSLEFVLR